MAESLSVAQEAVIPNGVDAPVYDREYSAADGSLVQMRLLCVFEKDGVECARRKLTIHDGGIRAAMSAVYEAARAPVYQAAHDAAYQPAFDAAINDGKTEFEAVEAARSAARTAGNQAVIDVGIVRGDHVAAWSTAKTKVQANESGTELVRLLVATDWGKLMLRKAWAEKSV